MLRSLKKKKNNKGFTLVELLVVIAIIGILAVVAVPSLFKQIDKAKVADVKANVGVIKTAAVANYSDTGVVAENIAALISAGDLDSNPSESGKITYELVSGDLVITNVGGYIKAADFTTLETDLGDTDAATNTITIPILK